MALVDDIPDVSTLSRPDCDPAILTSALKFLNQCLFIPSAHQFAMAKAAVMANPNLPFEQLKSALITGNVHAWMNPSTPMLLLLDPPPFRGDVDEGLCLAAIRTLVGRSNHETRPPWWFALCGYIAMYHPNKRGPFWDAWGDKIAGLVAP